MGGGKSKNLPVMNAGSSLRKQLIVGWWLFDGGGGCCLVGSSSTGVDSAVPGSLLARY